MRARAALVLAAIVLALLPLPQAFVERWYSTRLYIHIQHSLTSLSNLVPFALFDAMIAVTLTLWLVFGIADVRRRASVAVALRTVTWAAALYIAFLFLWGFNYRRTPLTAKLQYDASDVTPAAALALANISVDQLNALYDPAHADAHDHVSPAFGSIEPALSNALDRVQLQLGGAEAFLPARPKRTILNPFFRASAVEGMTDPFFLETLLESGLLPFERPFDTAHEWGHLAGYADESEASFLGWLACIHGSPLDQYSGWLFLFQELDPVAGGPNRAALYKNLASGPRADLRAIADRERANVNRTVARASGRIYDGYLKANRVEAGIESYDQVVRLALGVRFGPEWTPLLAAH